MLKDILKISKIYGLENEMLVAPPGKRKMTVVSGVKVEGANCESILYEV